MVRIMYLSEDIVHFSRMKCSLLEGSKWTSNQSGMRAEIDALGTATMQAEKTLVVPADHLPRQRRGD